MINEEILSDIIVIKLNNVGIGYARSGGITAILRVLSGRHVVSIIKNES